MKFGLAAIVGVIAAAAATSAYSAGPVNANTTAAANIVAASQLTAIQSLDFGTIAKPMRNHNQSTLIRLFFRCYRNGTIISQYCWR